MPNFKLSCVLAGHELDVRAVCIFPMANTPDAIVTGSRDRTVRLWVPAGDGKSYQENHCMSGHENYISSVCALPASEKYPQGLIMTGSNDCTINAYTLASPLPVYTLKGHGKTVCSLAAGKFGTLLSGSWDCTAKVWLNENCVMTLDGHGAAVWGVALMPTQGLMLTASADKLIKLWKAGKCERTFTGHEDCVRCLTVISELEFLSASNDTTIRRWILTGECIQVFHGHTNFIYSLSLLPNGQGFVSSGEDRTVRIWINGDCTQTITLPAQSIWAVSCLANGDIVTGASDGVGRVFTTDPNRLANSEMQGLFDRQLSSFTVPAKTQAFGDIKMEDLPGPADLENPGRKDGQTKLIRSDKKVEAFSWNASEGKWTKIGDVVGAEGDDITPSSKKIMYEGMEYDYVFDVDITEGDIPLKLPFNVTDDPWVAAQKFIHEHDLSQYYLEEVANFITKNAQGVTLEAPGPGLQDPITGGSRYVPGSSGDPSLPTVGRAAVEPQNVADPFTGGSRYVPGGMEQTSLHPPKTNHSPKQSNHFFPKTDFVTFDAGNTAAILGKIKELNQSLTISEQLTEEEVSCMEEFLMVAVNPKGSAPSAPQLNVLWKLLQWPSDAVFPGLDTLRLAVRHPVVNKHFCNDQDGDKLMACLLKLGNLSNPSTNQMLVLRTLCNVSCQPDGLQLMAKYREHILGSTADLNTSAHKGTRVALATLLLNYATLLGKTGDVESRSQCVSAAATTLEHEKEPEAVFRLMVAIGTLSADDNALAIARSLDILPIIDRYKGVTNPAKLGQCAIVLKQVLQ